MLKFVAIALGAGVASALLFIVSATPSLTVVALAYLTPLPIMIAALGFTHVVGGAATLVAGGTIALVIGPVAGLVFLLVLGGPAWFLSYLALLARPVVGVKSVDGMPKAVEWFPVGKLVLWLAALSTIPVLLIGGAVVLHYGGFRQAMTTLSVRLGAVFPGVAFPGGLALADLIRAAPIAMAASTFLMLALNLWLGGRVVLVSQRLTRPWPRLADELRLPRMAVSVFAAVSAASFLPDPAGLAAAVLAAALGMAFVIEGMAAAHVLTRGLTPRRLILGAIYATVIVLMPWPLLALAVLGCLDALVVLRGKQSPPSPPPSPYRS